jgi:hypothetical protein
MAQGSGFQGTFKVSPKPLAQVEPGKWYFGFAYLGCEKLFAVFDDPSNGQTPLQFAGGGHFLVACPHCAADRLYLTEQVQRFRAEKSQ